MCFSQWVILLWTHYRCALLVPSPMRGAGIGHDLMTDPDIASLCIQFLQVSFQTPFPISLTIVSSKSTPNSKHRPAYSLDPRSVWTLTISLYLKWSGHFPLVRLLEEDRLLRKVGSNCKLAFLAIRLCALAIRLFLWQYGSSLWYLRSFKTRYPILQTVLNLLPRVHNGGKRVGAPSRSFETRQYKTLF